MTGPITTNDLYGPSGSELPKEAPLPVTIEETPEIVMEETSNKKQETLPKKRSGCFGLLIKFMLFAGLVAGGIWFSSFIRKAPPKSSPVNQVSEIFPTPTPTPTPTPAVTNPAVTTVTDSGLPANWRSFEAVSGSTKRAFGGVTFKLPPDVLSPICDGTSCSSQGTYLPGGTRFTVAPRGAGQSLADFRGTAISDVGGITFTTKSVTVGGLPAMEFTGTFTGRTVSGYAFSLMRGVMIELTPTTSLEINHFTPSGIVADFASDDTLFDAILKTVTVAKAK